MAIKVFTTGLGSLDIHSRLRYNVRMTSSKRNNFWRFLAYVRPYSGYLVLAVIGGIVKFTVMDEVPEIVDSPNALELEQVQGRVEFDHVSFHYQKGCPVVEDINLMAAPGEKIALVGPSGSGKTTIVSLLPRFFDVGSGSIRIDGHDVRDIKVRSLRRHIGMVLQDPVLFSGTIRENILYGNPHATDEEIVQAAQAANAYGFITELPLGFDTAVGERGGQLSGGQRQRITIARAFLMN
jgi:ABC-type multidrug transport system fused ATPase/permease subunit